MHYYSDDMSLKEEHALSLNNRECHRATDIIEQTLDPGPKLKEWAKAAGFVNIREHVFKVPFGPWAKDPKLVSPARFSPEPLMPLN